jgi:hypothetical protein
MTLPDSSKHEIYQGAALDVDRHAGNEAPTAPVPKPQVGGAFELNSAVVRGKNSSRLSCLVTACLMLRYQHFLTRARNS